jgi:hypothetical protein
MNKINGNILIGSLNSQTRYINAKTACSECIRKNRGSIHDNRLAMEMGNGICEVCEDKKDSIYMLF